MVVVEVVLEPGDPFRFLVVVVMVVVKVVLEPGDPFRFLVVVVVGGEDVEMAMLDFGAD
jgi:hypothetical protein